MSDLGWLLSRAVQPISVLDILLVTALFYLILMLFRGTRAESLLRGLTLLAITLWLVGLFLPITAFNWLMRLVFPALVFALPVIFQPEIRRGLERLGRTGVLIPGLGRNNHAEMARVFDELGRASVLLSERKRGALIVMERETGLQDYIDTGVDLDADISAALLLTIFYPDTPLHDGAVMIRNWRLAAAGCLLPLSDSLMSDEHLGTRHRAGLGISEGTDALAIVVSEETGIISLAHNGHLTRNLNGEQLQRRLTALYTQRPVLNRWWRR
ncbi:MAG: diadenylate cyclase CdaA [Chloroflexi bacterium]|nr:diadenylate cyclase CdaA [Chloroflexota bacterium]MBU1749031.1 diadenylate cyclase CdaA [Chloroflexota bacterium]